MSVGVKHSAVSTPTRPEQQLCQVPLQRLFVTVYVSAQHTQGPEAVLLITSTACAYATPTGGAVIGGRSLSGERVA